MCIHCGNLQHVDDTPAAGGGPAGALNNDDRGTSGPNGKPSLTSDEAGAQIGRANTTWNGRGEAALGEAATVSYAFRATAPSQMPNGTSGFSTFNAQQIRQTELALQSWSDVANITFVRAGSGDTGASAYSNNAQMLFGNYASGASGAAAFAYYPGSGVGGDSWYNSSLSYNATPANLNYGRQVLTHEIGHAIGLAHPGDYNAGNGSPTYGNSASYYEDTRQYSIMSYWSETNTGGNNGGFYAAAPLMDDIAAAQRLYGANTATRTGDDVYGFGSNTGRDFLSAADGNSRLIFAAWDAGGTDTFDFSGYRQNQLIDLDDGAFSNVGGLVGNVSIARGVTIENASGGSGNDVIAGNEAGNTLRGNAGNDTIAGGAGADALFGGAGADRFVFHAATDSAPGREDRILDFQSGIDVVDLAPVDANALLAGDQGFVFVSSFTGRAAEATLRADGTGATTVFAFDDDGDGQADFSLLIAGRAVQADFAL